MPFHQIGSKDVALCRAQHLWTLNKVHFLSSACWLELEKCSDVEVPSVFVVFLALVVVIGLASAETVMTFSLRCCWMCIGLWCNDKEVLFLVVYCIMLYARGMEVFITRNFRTTKSGQKPSMMICRNWRVTLQPNTDITLDLLPLLYCL